MDISLLIKSGISQAFRMLYHFDLKSESIALQPSKKEFAGSHTFVTFHYSKISGKSPEKTGEEIGFYLIKNTDWLKDFNTVKGFLNLELTDNIWLSVLKGAHESNNYGFISPTGKKALVEFSSPTSHKPLHPGHLRGAFLAYSLSMIMEANGYEVLKVNRVNDYGISIFKAMLTYQKFGNSETPESSGLKGDHLVGKYASIFDREYEKEIRPLSDTDLSAEAAEKDAPLLQEARRMQKMWKEGDAAVVAQWKKFNRWTNEGFEKTYQKIGVSFDATYKESDSFPPDKDIVQEGLEKGIFYQKADHSVWADLTSRKSDHKVIDPNNGDFLSIANDMIATDLKYKDFQFEKLIHVISNEEEYYYETLFAIMQKLGRSYADGLHHLSYGMADLPAGKMQSRSGTAVKADDLISETIGSAKERAVEKGKIEGFGEEAAEKLFHDLGLGALKYYLLETDPKRRIIFDPKTSIELQGKTGPFVQYTYARVSSICRRARELGITPEVVDDIDLQPSEIATIALLGKYREKIVQAGRSHSPSVIARYAYAVAKSYNRFFQEVPIFNEDNESKVAMRVALSAVVGKVIGSSLSLLGIESPQRM